MGGTLESVSKDEMGRRTENGIMRTVDRRPDKVRPTGGYRSRRQDSVEGEFLECPNGEELDSHRETCKGRCRSGNEHK